VSSAIYLSAAAGVITPPFILTNGYIYQPVQTTVVADSGRAAWDFTLASAGSYVVSASVNAPDEGANSFFVNIDAEPLSPDMIWTVPITVGFEQRLVSWLADGSQVPKVFTLTQGPHQLVIRGREPYALLKNVSLVPVP
jgi:hypothetical protein